MTTAIIGVGNIGNSIARHLVDGGERVVLAARDGSNATALANELGELASAASVEKAITEANVVLFAVWLDTLKDLIAQHADLLRGKVVVDRSNPVAQDTNGGSFGRFPRTSPRALSSPSCSPPRLTSRRRSALSAPSHWPREANRTPRAVLFYATDDDQASAAIERLISAAGFDPVKAGGVDAALRIETSGALH
jgi:predicted dinucleotide-binding enzyme